MGDFVGRHGSIAHEDDFVVAIVFVHDIEGGHAFAAPAVVAPHGFVDAVVKVEIFEMLEFVAGG